MERVSRRQWLRHTKTVLAVGMLSATVTACLSEEPPAPKEPVALRLLVPQLTDALLDSLATRMEKAVAEVNATEPAGWRLQLQTLEAQSATWSRLVTESTSAGAAPADLVATHVGDVSALAPAKVLLSLETYRQRDASLDLADYYRAALAAHRWQGKLYAVPFVTSPLVMFYGRNLFAAAALPPPTAQWTWDDLRATAEALTRDLDGDGKPDQWGYLQLPGYPPSLQYIWQNGGDVLGPSGAVLLEEPAAVAAVEFMASLVHEARVSPNLRTVNLAQIGQLAERGRIGLVHFNVSVGGIFWRSSNFAYDLAEPPRQQQQATILTTTGLGIGARSAHPDAAWQALRVLTDAIERRSLMPARQSLAKNLRQIEPRLTEQDMAVMHAAMAYARAPQWERYHEVMATLLRELDRPVLLGTKPVPIAVRDAADALDRLLARPRQR